MARSDHPAEDPRVSILRDMLFGDADTSAVDTDDEEAS
jgi:hypothetical protein